MRWLRSHRRLTRWVALFALTLQLVLSFGHVHAPPAGEPAVGASTHADGGAPAQPADRDDDYCAICAILALLSGSHTAPAPTLPALVASTPAEITVAAELARATRPHAAFRSRAPPIS